MKENYNLTHQFVGTIGAVGLSAGAIGIALVVTLAAPGLAQSRSAPPPDLFPPNPLEVPVDDPLQPQGNLTGATQARLREQLANLNQQALAQLQAGDDKAAFDLWNRQLRLTRSLGPIEETKALAQIGTIAWEKNNTQQVRYISQRLQKIQAEAAGQPNQSPQTPTQPNPNPKLWTELAAAYQGIRAPELAINVYRNQLATARQTVDPLGEFQALNAIGQTHLDWFGYPRAAKTYQELLEQARSNNDKTNQIAYLYQLAYIHEQGKNPQEAATALQALIPLYREAIEQQQPDPLSTNSTRTNPTQANPTQTKNQAQSSGQSAPETANPNVLAFLEIRLADSYAASQQADLAERAYQSAYKTAQTQVQLGYAGDALRQLGKFYRSQNRFDAAVQVYDFLTSFEQEETQNLYNAMDAYDQMGQTFLQSQQTDKAISAFQRGLQVAQALNYRTAYFSDRISQARSPAIQPPKTPAP